MAMDEVVGRQTLKEPVDMAVTDAAGQGQKEVETAEVSFLTAPGK